MNNKLKPALIGGVVLGLLSIIPIVNWVNFCCCLWAILGGLLASHLYIKNSPTPVSAGDGAIVGALAGVVGAIIVVVLGIPLNFLVGESVRALLLHLVQNINPAQAEMMQGQMAASAVGEIVRGLIGAVLVLIFSVLGGLLGVPIFEKRKSGAVPPPPPNYVG